MRPERAKRTGAELAQIIDHDLVHDLGERELERAYRAVGDDERAFVHPLGLEQFLASFETRGLDHDVGALKAALPVRGDDDPLAEIGLEPAGKGVAAFLAARVDADLCEIEEAVEEPHIPIGRSARADMTEN